MNLQELRDKAKTMDRPLDAKVIDEFIESTVLHLWHTYFEFDDIGDWREALCNHTNNRIGERFHYENEANISIGNDDIDIWLILNYSIECYISDSYGPTIINVEILSLKCNWMNTEWNLTFSKALRTLIIKEIESW